MHDVLIMGGGTAATFAAIRLARADLDVAVVFAGPPSALMCRGVAFVGGGFPGDGGFAALWSEVFPRVNLGPDTYLGHDGSAVRADRAVDGAARLSAVVERDVLVMDVHGLPGPDAVVLASRLKRHMGRVPRFSVLRLQYSADDFGLTPVLWARRFDDPARRAELVSHLLRRLMDEPSQVVLMPAVLGIDFNKQLLDIMDESAPGKVMELLGGPGWPPGARMAAALTGALQKSGVTLVRGQVVGVGRAGPDGLGHVLTDRGDELHAGRFILATGNMVGGGLRLDQGLREAALGLPVFVRDRPAPGSTPLCQVDPTLLFGEDPAGDQPIIDAGLSLDEQGRPVDKDGRVVHHNLWACGSVVAAKRGSAVIDPGVSAWSGYRTAGMLI